MATGFPTTTGTVVSSDMWNGLTSYQISTQSGATYTFASTDQYQVLVVASNASTKTFSIPTDATYAFPNGTAITVLNTGAGALTLNAVSSGTTTVTSAGAVSASPTLAQFKAAVCLKISTNTWTIVGAVG
jgi:hypothetical protein